MRAILALLFGLFVVFVVGTYPARAQDGQWTIIESSGSVLVLQSMAAARQVSTRESLGPGSTITTGGDGRAVLRRGEQEITAGPNSRISLPVADASGFTRIIQELGAAMFKVDSREVQHFQVDTPLISAVVKGTTFTVSVGANSHSVHVVEGLVEVSPRNGGMAVGVPAGVTGVIFRDNLDIVDLSDSATGAAIVPGQEASLVIPETIGDAPLDIDGLTDGLVRSEVVSAEVARAGDVGTAEVGSGEVVAGEMGVKGEIVRTEAFTLENAVTVAENRNADAGVLSAGDVNPNGGSVNTDPGVENPNAVGGDAVVVVENPNAGITNPYAGVGDVAAGVGNPNAADANPNSTYGNPNADSRNPNAASEVPDAGSADANVGIRNPNAG